MIKTFFVYKGEILTVVQCNAVVPVGSDVISDDVRYRVKMIELGLDVGTAIYIHLEIPEPPWA